MQVIHKYNEHFKNGSIKERSIEKIAREKKDITLEGRMSPAAAVAAK